MFSRLHRMFHRIQKKQDESDSAPVSGHQSASHYTLQKEWEELQNKIDWMSAPTMPEYVNGLVSGKSLSEGGHWALYAKEKHVIPLFNRRGEKLEMVSLACGSGHIEESLVVDFSWPVKHLIGLEYDDQLRSSAIERFNKIDACSSRFEFFDFNEPEYPEEQFDIVFTCHSIHHANNVEDLLVKINRMLKVDGLVIGIDFFGPTRFQVEYDVFPILEELFSFLAPNLRRNLLTSEMIVQDTFTYDTIEGVRKADLSESIRSSDLRTLLFSTFPVVEIKPMGGTLLRWLLQYRAGDRKSVV